MVWILKKIKIIKQHYKNQSKLINLIETKMKHIMKTNSK
jgi:hypothetical protein